MRRAATLLLAAAVLAVAIVAATDAVRGGGDSSSERQDQPGPGTVTAERDGSPAELATAAELSIARPAGLAVAGGLVWVASEGTLVGLDPAGAPAQGRLDLGGRAGEVLAGDGSVYVIDEAAGDAIRVDVTSRSVAGRLATEVPVRDVAFAGGDAWVPDPSGAVLRVDPASGAVLARIAVPAPTAVAAGAGAVWALSPQARLLSRIDPASNLVAPIPLADAPGQVAVAGGAVWVSHPVAGALSRIDPAHDTVSARIELDSGPLLIAGAGNGLWVLGLDRLSWLDARTGRIAGVAALNLTRPPGPEPLVLGGLAAGEGAAWVADTYGGVVIRVDAPV